MPRRGLPVAAIMVPRWYRPVVWDERRPRGSNPRGPLRGGPERSAGDPRLSKTTQHQDKREVKGKKETKRPTVITVDKDGREACWGPLSRHSAGKAGHLWEDMRSEVHVFLEKDGHRKEVQVEKRLGRGNRAFGS